MIERVVRNDEVAGLIPVCSTILRRSDAKVRMPSEALAQEGFKPALPPGCGWRASGRCAKPESEYSEQCF